MLYFSLIQSHLNYCITTWGGSPKSVLNPLLVLQKKAIRIITYSKYDSHSKPLFNELQILTINNLYQLNLATLIYKLHHNQTVSTSNLIPITQIHKYQTRLSKSHNYYQTFNKSNLSLASYISNGIKLWKILPTHIKSMPLQKFKLEVKTILHNNQLLI